MIKWTDFSRYTVIYAKQTGVVSTSGDKLDNYMKKYTLGVAEFVPYLEWQVDLD